MQHLIATYGYVARRHRADRAAARAPGRKADPPTASSRTRPASSRAPLTGNQTSGPADEVACDSSPAIAGAMTPGSVAT
jgi:hypothetical protein